MSRRTGHMTDALHAYMLQWGVAEPLAVRALREDTRKLEQDGWQSSPEQAQFLALLAGLMGAKRFRKGWRDKNSGRKFVRGK